MLATMSDAVREYASNCGAPANVAWILHDYDVWVANPRYAGPYLGHPEYDDYLGSCFLTFADASVFASQQAKINNKATKVVRYNSVFVVYI